MRIVLLGGTGHIGTYLLPRLVTAGHEVIVVARGEQKPYRSHGGWESVQRVKIDRTAAERTGDFGQQIAALEGDIVIDLICFALASATQLVEQKLPRRLAKRHHAAWLCGTSRRLVRPKSGSPVFAVGPVERKSFQRRSRSHVGPHRP